VEKIDKILLAVGLAEGQEACYGQAVKMARDSKARLKIVHTIPRRDDDKLQTMRETALEKLRALTAPSIPEDLPHEYDILVGNPAVAVTQEVVRNGHDLAMVIPNNRRQFLGMTFGSTTLRLMRVCPCPIWAIKPPANENYTSILAPVAYKEGSADELNRRILDLAFSLGRRDGATVHVFHSWDSYGWDVDPNPVEGSPEELRYRKRIQWFDELVKPYGLDHRSENVVFLQGDPGELIPENAERMQHDLIIMGTICRSGLSGFFMGNTAERILLKVSCSVLALKPDKFETPVKPDET